MWLDDYIILVLVIYLEFSWSFIICGIIRVNFLSYLKMDMKVNVRLFIRIRSEFILDNGGFYKKLERRVVVKVV